MSNHPALGPGKVAVITGAADGIGLAAAQKFVSLGMRVCMADIHDEKLADVAGQLAGVLAVPTDVSKLEDLQSLKEKTYANFGQVDVLMNNAGTGSFGNDSWTQLDNWMSTLSVNLNGVINGIHCFVPSMLKQSTPGLVINTGSKQGITLPPGNPAYNVSKAGVKAVTELLQHDLRNLENCHLSAHLLVPGFTYSGMVRQFLPEKPDSAWTTEQVIAYMIEHIEQGDFYILCPDNDVTREIDNKRIAWSSGDLIQNRTPLSRWDPDYEGDFAAFMQE